MPAKVETQSSNKREAILDAMLDLVVERGLHDAPMSAVTARSGASPGVIYHYFPSKDDLIRSLYARVARKKRDALLEGYSDAMPQREGLLKVWLNAYRFYRKHPKELRFLDQYLNSTYCAGGEAPDPAFARIAQLLQEMGKVDHVSIAESNEEVGEQLAAVIKTVYSGDLPIYRLGAVLGTHTGPGTVAIAAVIAGGVVLGVAQMLGHLTLKRSLQHRLSELFQQSIYVLCRSSLIQQAVDQLIADRLLLFLLLHSVLLFLPGERLHRI